MKRFIKSALVSCLSIVMLLTFVFPVSAHENDKTLENGYYPENSQVYINASPAMREMYDLQNRITDKLDINEGKYVYDYHVIKELIYSFDFTELNKELDNPLTKEGFLTLVISRLDSVQPSIQNQPTFSTFAYTQGAMCGVNKRIQFGIQRESIEISRRLRRTFIG